MNRLTIDNLNEIPFNVKEAFSKLRISLSGNDDVKTIMVTGVLSGDGKDYVSARLWKLFAEAGAKVVLIDCNLRGSDLGGELSAKRAAASEGIVEYLQGTADIDSVIYETSVENGYIIPAVSTAACPMQLLDSERFKSLLAYARQNFDYAIIVTPPIDPVADALSVACDCDGSLLVIRSKTASKRTVVTAASALARTGKPILGYVLNAAGILLH